MKNRPRRHTTAINQEVPLDPPTLFLLYLLVRISARRFISRRAHWRMDFVTFEQRLLVCKQARNMLMTSTLSFPLLLAILRSFFFFFFRKTPAHYEAGAGSVDCCDCSPSGFKSSHYSLRATVLLQMLIVFSFCLSPGAFLPLSLSLAVYTINLAHSPSHTHSLGLARRERLEGGIWTYLTEGHPSLSSPTAHPPQQKATLCSSFASSWFDAAHRSFTLFYCCAAYNYNPP